MNIAKQRLTICNAHFFTLQSYKKLLNYATFSISYSVFSISYSLSKALYTKVSKVNPPTCSKVASSKIAASFAAASVAATSTLFDSLDT